ncbi:MAG: porin [Coprobacter sp.]|nr:porin [Coprobacter sp.]
MNLLFLSEQRTKRGAALLFSVVLSLGAPAEKPTVPVVGGVVRARYELMTTDGRSRLAVRNARIWVRGNIIPRLSYVVSTDLCDQGKFKFLDAYAKFDVGKGVAMQAGQFRIPFGVDPFRGPGSYIFADRSFIGRDIDDIRAVGFQTSYRVPGQTAAVITAGIFSPNAITDQNHWSKTFHYAVKAEVPVGPVRITGGWQTVKPEAVRMNMTDACISFTSGEWSAEAEYILQHYVNQPFPDCHACNVWVDYGIPLKKTLFNRLSFQGRFDASTRYSDGSLTGGSLSEVFPDRKRISAGSTLSYVNKGVKCEIQLNYQKYFYRKGYSAPEGRNDKVVAELIILF